MCSLIALQSEKMLVMILFSLNLLRFNLWPKMWSILENVPCALEKKVYSAFGWKFLKILIRSIWSSASFKIFVLINFLFWWSVHWCKWGVKVPYYFCVAVNFPFYVYVLSAPMLCGLTFIIVMHSSWIDPLIIMHCPFFMSCNILYFKDYVD